MRKCEGKQEVTSAECEGWGSSLGVHARNRRILYSFDSVWDGRLPDRCGVENGLWDSRNPVNR